MQRSKLASPQIRRNDMLCVHALQNDTDPPFIKMIMLVIKVTVTNIWLTLWTIMVVP